MNANQFAHMLMAELNGGSYGPWCHYDGKDKILVNYIGPHPTATDKHESYLIGLLGLQGTLVTIEPGPFMGDYSEASWDLANPASIDDIIERLQQMLKRRRGNGRGLVVGIDPRVGTFPWLYSYFSS